MAFAERITARGALTKALENGEFVVAIMAVRLMRYLAENELHNGHSSGYAQAGMQLFRGEVKGNQPRS